MAEAQAVVVDEKEKLFMFMAGELQGACSHIFASFEEYFRSGKEPESAFKKQTAAANAKKRGRKGAKNPDKPKRKPTAFNNFIKERISEFRAAGKLEELKDNNGVFAAAVAEWGKLTDDEKKVYTANFKEHEGADEAADADATLAAAEAAASEAVHGTVAEAPGKPEGKEVEDDDEDDDEDDSDDDDEDDEEEEEVAPPKEPTPPPPAADVKKEKKRKNKAAAEEQNGKKAKATPAQAVPTPAPKPASKKAEPKAPELEITKPAERKQKRKPKNQDRNNGK